MDEFLTFLKSDEEDEYQMCNQEEYRDIQTKVHVLHKACGHIYAVTPNKFKQGRRCPVCAVKERAKTQSYTHDEFLSKVKSLIGDEYTVLEKYKDSKTKVKMMHKVCGLYWDAIPSGFFSGARCPKCNHTIKQAKIGLNDLWTTNPQIAKMLFNPQDGYAFSSGSNKKVDWICPSCKKKITSKTINKVVSYGVACPYCSDGISYPEKVFANLLSSVNIVYEKQKQFEWSGKYRYDFYFTKNNVEYVIESDGGYHFNDSKYSKKNDVQLNDFYKAELPQNHNIHLIRVDCRISDITYIKTNIFNSELEKLFDFNNIDWEYIDRMSTVSLVAKSAELFNDGIVSTKIISECIGVAQGTAIRYLHKASLLGICSYIPDKNRETHNEINKKQVVAMNNNNILLFNSIGEANKHIGQNPNNNGISKCCRKMKNYKTAGGYKWMYYEDYIKQQEQNQAV